MRLQNVQYGKSVLRKDITRFAPFWGIYLACGILLVLTTVGDFRFRDPRHPYINNIDAAWEFMYTVSTFSIVNLIYGLLSALLLFGYLFDAKQCETIHVMIPRRGTLFLAHATAGLLFSIVPNLIMALIAMPFLQDVWFVALLWLLAVTLEYVFFFGVAIFSVFCSGKRIAALVVYAALNFGSLVVLWFWKIIYAPMLYGITVSEGVFIAGSPVSYLMLTMLEDNIKLVEAFVCGMFPTAQVYSWFGDLLSYLPAGGDVVMPTEFGLFLQKLPKTELAVFSQFGYGGYVGLGRGWGYLMSCAATGVVFTVISLAMYCRRKLETAEDLLAAGWMRPVFAGGFALITGCVISMVSNRIKGGYLLPLFVGVSVGWLVAKMLLERTVNVFRWKVVLQLVALVLALGITLGMTHWDVFGITQWVPKDHQISTVQIDVDTGFSSEMNHLELTDAQKVHLVTQAHEQVLRSRNDISAVRLKREFTIRYTLTTGICVTRTYLVWGDSEAWRLFQEIYDNHAYWD